jgi:hypothetical protein
LISTSLKKSTPLRGAFLLAEREGFEPLGTLTHAVTGTCQTFERKAILEKRLFLTEIKTTTVEDLCNIVMETQK